MRPVPGAHRDAPLPRSDGIATVRGQVLGLIGLAGDVPLPPLAVLGALEALEAAVRRVAHLLLPLQAIAGLLLIADPAPTLAPRLAGVRPA